jgi:cytochrome c553
MAHGKIEHRDVLFAAAGMAIALAVGLGLFIVSGVYNVSAAKPHLDPTAWLLDIVRRQSVRFHSMGIDVPALEDAGLIRLGAAHFESACAGCHGAPGRAPAAFARGMLPEPPALSATVNDWATEELFWIVRNGQKYTGMPAWSAVERADEVWPVTAFLRRLPSLEPRDYEGLAGTRPDAPESAPVVGATPLAPLLYNCARCHGEDGASPVTGAVPVIRGQLQSYLRRSLLEFRAGTRRSGIMQIIAAGLEEEEVNALAAHYAGNRLSSDMHAPPSAAAAERGRTIFTEGVAEQDVPACAACHDNGADRSMPLLAGQSAAYTRQQLLLWQAGWRRVTTHERLMAPLAARMTRTQIEDVALYLQGARADPTTGAR